MLGDPEMILPDSESIKISNKSKGLDDNGSYPVGETQSLQLKLSVSDEESDVEMEPESENKEPIMSNTLPQDEDSDDSDDDVLIRPKTKKVSKIADDDSSDDEKVVTKKPVLESSDSDSSEDDGDLKTKSNTEKKTVFQSLNNDLYDDEGNEDGSDHDNNSNHSNNSGSEEDGEYEISEELKKKLQKMKGAGKRPTTTRKSKTAAQQEMQDIHSESQRLTRESRVSLPYHKPKPLSLQEILEKRRQKVSDTVPLRAPIHKVLAKTGVVESPYIARKFKQRQERKDKQKSPSNSQKDNVSKSELPQDCSPESVDKKTQGNVCSMDDDELPDLVEPDVTGQSQNTQANESLEECSLAPGNTITENTDHETCEMDTESATIDSEKVNDAIPTSDETSVKDSETDNATGTVDDAVAKDGESVDTMDDSRVIITACNDESESSSEAKMEVEESKDLSTPKCSAFKKSILADTVLPEIKGFTPKLSCTDDFIVDLDADVEKYSGISKLMNRAMKHAMTKKVEQKKEVEMSVVCKETDESNKEQLKLKTFTVTIEGEEEVDPKLQKPGAKLSKLKDVLQTEMRRKREEARMKRVELYDLDNEEGFEDEEEAELTDQSDTDEEGDEEDDAEGDDELMENDDAIEKEDVNPFIEDECEDDDDDSAGGFKLHLDAEDDEQDNLDAEQREENRAKFLKSAQTKSNDKVPDRPFKMLSQKTIELDEMEEGSPNKKERRESLSDADSSFEITPYQPVKKGRDSPELFSQFAKPKTPKESRQSSLCLPIEDSQDIMNSPSQFKNTYVNNSESFHLSLFDADSQSQLLDDEGFLKVDSEKKPKSSKRHLDLGLEENASQGFDELLGLCSGQFTEGTQQKSSVKKLFDDAAEQPAATQDNMNELLGLCSGVFNDRSPEKKQNEKDSDSSKSKKKSKRIVESDDENSNDSFQILEDDNQSDAEKNMSESENEAEDEVENSDDEEDSVHEEEYKGFTMGKKAGKIRAEFLENEAELSGSEFDSDENDDLDDKDDVLELEEGDFDDVGTEDDLRNQVEKAHMRQVLDEDNREIRLMQEMFLPDGDLYSENKRARKFRWANIDDPSGDMFKNTSDDEAVEETEEETSWRVERLAREKWLAEEQEKEGMEEDSQFIKLGKKIFKAKPSSIEPSKEKAEETKVVAANKNMFSLSQSRRGSFLSRPKETLAKIGEVAKTSLGPNSTKNSKNFVFAMASPDAKTEDKPKVQKSRSVNDGVKPPNAKKPRLERSNTFNNNSIFNLM